ncbi:MAG: glycoside hydrolase family 3 C-terminal domain-containing protein [Anaerolineae bacterium]
MNEKIENLITQMTLEEKVSMLAGADLWHTVPVERLGIPAIRVTDGPNGARGSQARGGPSSVCFPVGIALAATWNPELVERVGMALGEETKAKGAHILLAPTVNIHRSTLNGRNFECYSEDPYLSGRMATAYVNGLQSQEVGACIKHFVCNDSEFERFTTSSEVSERALREIYLTPFRMAVRDAKPWAVMSAYNKINGTWASENPYTLLDILKGEWEFDGIVMSDWFGSNSVDVANGGLDLEMPGPARWLGDKVLEAVKAGEVSAEVIDDKVRRLLRTIIRAGAFEQPELRPEQAIDKPEHRRLVREAAGEAIVLLKNTNDILPLDVEKLNTLAIIGPNAKAAQVQGGGSAHVTPHYVVTPYDGILNRVGDSVQVSYEIGCTIHKASPLIDTSWLKTTDASENGLAVEYFDNRDLSGDPVHTIVTGTTELIWFGSLMPHENIDPDKFFVRLTGTFTPPETGTFTFGLTGFGLNRLFIDGEKLINNWETLAGREESTVEVKMVADQSYRLQVEYGWEGGSRWRALRLGCTPPISPESINDAVALAAQSDVALVFAGLTGEWESEGYDRSNMELAGDQVELIEKVAAANPNTVVVLNTGSPITMNWLDKVAAVVQAWYPGQEAGNSIADVLFGDVNPSGKLPQTFPKRIQDNPAYINYPGENGKVHYGEGIFVGYRYYDKKDIEPLFPFGYGLSYTTFAYKNLALNADEYMPGDEVQVSVDVENTGPRTGKEIVQLYVRDTESSLARPEKELKAFAKVTLEPGETKTVTFTLDQDALSFYDPVKKQWVAEPGEFQVLVGGSSRDIHLTECFVLKGGPETVLSKAARLHVGLSMKELQENEAANAVLEKHIPEVMASPQLAMAMGMSLEQIAGFVPQILTSEKLGEINNDLATASA